MKIVMLNQLRMKRLRSLLNKLLLQGQALLMFQNPMISIAALNIRGLNHLPKQQEVQQVVRSNKLSICAILDSHVAVSKLQNICASVFGNWYWTSNSNKCEKGTRIIRGSDPDVVDVMKINQTRQVLNCQVKLINENKHFFCSFIYAGNHYWYRKSLWRDLNIHKCFVDNRPWVLLGDFNVALNIEDTSTGTSGITYGMSDFKECVEKIEVEDINMVGLHYMWTNDQMLSRVC